MLRILESQGSAFDPAASSSSATVACGSAECSCGRPPCGCSAAGECTYSRTYGEPVQSHAPQQGAGGCAVPDAHGLPDNSCVQP